MTYTLTECKKLSSESSITTTHLLFLFICLFVFRHLRENIEEVTAHITIFGPKVLTLTLLSDRPSVYSLSVKYIYPALYDAFLLN